MNTKNIQREIKIVGYIRGLEKNRGGHFFAVFIETEIFQKYIVHDGVAKDLMKYLNQKVKVTCKVVNMDIDENKIIEVIQYELLDENQT